MTNRDVTEAPFSQLATADLTRVCGGISDADAVRIKKQASAFCPKTVKSNASLDYKALTKDSAMTLANQCLSEMKEDTSEDGKAAYAEAQKRLTADFGKYFP